MPAGRDAASVSENPPAERSRRGPGLAPWAAGARAGQLLGPQPGGNVLDRCAAPGGKTRQRAAAGAHVTALDISAPRMEKLRENLTRTRLQAKIVVAEALHWQTATGLGFRMPGGYFNGPYGDGDRSGVYGVPLRFTASLLRDVRQSGVVPVVDAQARAEAREDFAHWRAGAPAAARPPHHSQAGFRRKARRRSGPRGAHQESSSMASP